MQTGVRTDCGSDMGVRAGGDAVLVGGALETGLGT